MLGLCIRDVVVSEVPAKAKKHKHLCHVLVELIAMMAPAHKQSAMQVYVDFQNDKVVLSGFNSPQDSSRDCSNRPA